MYVQKTAKQRQTHRPILPYYGVNLYQVHICYEYRHIHVSAKSIVNKQILTNCDLKFT